MFFAILLSQMTVAAAYDLKFVDSNLFTRRDRARLTKYFSADYIFVQKQKQRAKFSEKLFRYLRDTSSEEVKKEMAENPYAGIEWPDNREVLETLMLKIENDQ